MLLLTAAAAAAVAVPFTESGMGPCLKSSVKECTVQHEPVARTMPGGNDRSCAE